MKRSDKMDIFCSAVSTPDLLSAQDINYNDADSQSLLRTFSLNEVTLISVNANYQCSLCSLKIFLNLIIF